MVKWAKMVGRLGPTLSGLSLGAVYVLFLQLSWRRSAHPLVDFGREVYTAWRLSIGDLLYRDVTSLFGPAAAYIDASVLALFGPSLEVLFRVNAGLIFFSAALVYAFVLQLTRHMTAFLAALTFLAVFAFGHLGGPNYNFLTPYSQAAVWGVVFGMSAVVCLHKWLTVESHDRMLRCWPFIAGVLVGLTILTKPEIALASLGVSGVALALGSRTWEQRDLDRTGCGGSAAFWLTGGVVIPLMVTFVAFSVAGSLSLAGKAVSASFAPLFSASPTSMAFYRYWAGFNEPVARITEMLIATTAVVGLMVGLGVIDRLLFSRVTGRLRSVGRALLLVGGLAVIAGVSGGMPLVFNSVARAMPLLLLGALYGCVKEWSSEGQGFVGSGSEASSGSRDRDSVGVFKQPRQASVVVWLSFSLLLLLKLALFPRFTHYGFYLAAPAGIAMVIVLVELLPRWIGGWVGSSGLARLFGVTLVVLTAVSHGLASGQQLGNKDVPIASGSDALWAEEELAEAVDRTLDQLEELASPDATLVVLPEGAMLNYWSRRRNPTRYVSFMPPELAFHGVEQMRSALEAARPDFVLLYERPLLEYGGGVFGDRQATGSDIVGFVRRDYRCLIRVPIPGRSFEFEILGRRDLAGAFTDPSNC